MKALVGAFNQEKALVGAFSVIVETDCETDGALHNTDCYPAAAPQLGGVTVRPIINLCPAIPVAVGGWASSTLSCKHEKKTDHFYFVRQKSAVSTLET